MVRTLNSLPFRVDRVKVPPIKCQGIKTKLVPFIFRNIEWTGKKNRRWIEPFLGSGVVAFNLACHSALLSDTNPHIINFYRAIQNNDIDQNKVRNFLAVEGEKLATGGADYYYEVRARFNGSGSPLDFLFLNRSCFNGLIRFNRRGEFNVPFGHKPNRFSKSYITKISNQVNWVSHSIRNKNIDFRVAHWRDILKEAGPDDFVYMDPPYIGRHTDYYNSWSPDEAAKLASAAQDLSCGFAASMWLRNSYRKNDHIYKYWNQAIVREYSHFYHVGSNEEYRNEMIEALIIKPGYEASNYTSHSPIKEQDQMTLFETPELYLQ